MTHDHKQTMSFTDSLKELQEELRTGKPQPDKPTSLPLKAIRYASTVFQPRQFDGNKADSVAHVMTLKDAVRAKQTLPPITVWWSGKSWRVLDGHHRMMAYQQLASDKKRPLVIHSVPVEVFEGSLNQAIAHATECNSRDKLPMSRDDKLDRAWKLVALRDPSLSREAIAHTAGVSDRTVGNMRAKLATFLTENSDDDPLNWTWAEIKADEVKPEKDNSWAEQEAQRWSKRLLREFGPKIGRHPDILARAIEITSDKLPFRIVRECWIEEAREAVQGSSEDDF